jgi:transcriptional regulator with XRE-family HTH domain
MAKKRKSDRDVLLKRVGARIRELRLEKGLSQEGLALAAGLDRSYVGGVERGERNIAIINLKKIADALNLPLTRLVRTIT